MYSLYCSQKITNTPKYTEIYFIILLNTAMSLVFSRVNIISQSQHDAEVNNPSVPVPKPPRSYLQVLKDSINQEDNVDITSVASNSRSNEGW